MTAAATHDPFHGLPSYGLAEIGYGIEERSRGNGLVTKTTRACVDWALAQPGITAV